MNFPGIEFLGTVTKFRGRKRSLQSCVYVLHKTSLEGISRRSRAVTTKKCTKKCAARTKLLFLPSLVDVAVVVLKLPNKRPLDSTTRTPDYEEGTNLKLLYFTYSQKIYTPEHFDVRIFFFFFTKKVSKFNFIEGG